VGWKGIRARVKVASGGLGISVGYFFKSLLVVNRAEDILRLYKMGKKGTSRRFLNVFQMFSSRWTPRHSRMSGEFCSSMPSHLIRDG
jgi:hypothetical protein